MAQRKVNGKDVLLMIDPLGGTTYNTIVCLTSNSLQRTTGTESANSKCGPDSGPGEQNQTISFAGQIVYEPGSTKLSAHGLSDLWKNSTGITWKMGVASPVSGDVVQSGAGWISELSETYDVNGRATFTGTIVVTGDITETVTA